VKKLISSILLSVLCLSSVACIESEVKQSGKGGYSIVSRTYDDPYYKVTVRLPKEYDYCRINLTKNGEATGDWTNDVYPGRTHTFEILAFDGRPDSNGETIHCS